MGKVIFYSVKIPVTDRNGQITGSYPLNLRSDPRRLEYINSSVNSSQITFIRDKTVYISISPNAPPCEYGNLAMYNFAGFLGGFGNMQLQGAVSDKNYSKETNNTFVNCMSEPYNTVILVEHGNETKIERLREDCYKLTYKNCEIIEVTERFDLLIIEEYMKFFERKN
jgi:hypothetical protein